MNIFNSFISFYFHAFAVKIGLGDFKGIVKGEISPYVYISNCRNTLIF